MLHPYDTSPIETIEFEFLPVGEGSRSGDAIVASWKPAGGRRRIVVIDGGYSTTGERIVQLILDRWCTSTVDLVISTHPDEDHANGLLPVLTDLTVNQLWMHKPWEHARAAGLYAARFADRSLDSRIAKNLDAARVLAEKALEKGVPVSEPFTGRQAFDGVLEVIGPDEEFYEELLPEFRCVTETSGGSSLLTKASALATRVREAIDIETLTDDGDTSSENESSVLVQFRLNDQRIFLTGDAGLRALERAADELDRRGITTEGLHLIQVPHHGSHHNVGPSVLDRLIGPKGNSDAFKRFAVVSAAPDGEPKHPNRKVTNAFRRRGAHVWATQGRSLRYAPYGPDLGYEPVAPLPLYTEVDE